MQKLTNGGSERLGGGMIEGERVYEGRAWEEGIAHPRSIYQTDLATGHNQTTGLTNGRVTNWALEVTFSPFGALFRPQLTLPFCC